MQTAPLLGEVLSALFKKYRLTQEDLVKISSKLYSVHLNKGELFSEMNKTCTRLGILVSGLLCAVNEDDPEEATESVSRLYYTPENIIVTSFESFYGRTPAQESIRAIEESRLFYIVKTGKVDPHRPFQIDPLKTDPIKPFART